MSEVKRYGHIGYLVNASSRLCGLYPSMTVYVKASDYDDAQAELSALREELANEKARIPQYIAERAQTEQRLTAAELRNAELVAASEKALDVFRSMLRDKSCGMHYASAQAACHQISAALKPTESGASE